MIRIFIVGYLQTKFAAKNANLGQLNYNTKIRMRIK